MTRPRRQVAFAYGRFSGGFYAVFEHWRVAHKMSRGRAARKLIEKALLAEGCTVQMEPCACGDDRFVGDACATCGRS